MKKTILTFAIVLGLGLTTFADNGGLFNRGAENTSSEPTTEGSNRVGAGFPSLPGHGQDTNQPAPLGSGIALLTVLGGAYLVGKRRREE